RVMTLTTGEFVSAAAGLIVGLLIGALVGLPMANLPDPYRWLLPIGTVAVTGLGMMGLTVAKRHDLAEALRSAGVLKPPTTDSAATPIEGPVVYVDTSVLIDGRLTDVVASGFLWGKLVVPRFVVAELQHIADQRDANRRARGRRGLEILAVLQKDPRIAVELPDEDVATETEVDAKLVALARRRGAAILTNDFNLNRVAQLDDVRVLNLNHLANAIKPAFLPGDTLKVKVTAPGKEPGQGVAYLDDGTLIVVEGGTELIDKEVEVNVTRVLQTVAGRMVFAQPRN
ncbi:MAG TPA: PIN domain-containing protein, partial [Candidatus Limnocylindria bacterium]|nr:PIN domain-containing protein [Candidatus Limnocylindria bacterium]